MGRILYIVAREHPLLCGYLMAKVDARSPDGHSVEIKLDERKGERRRQSQARAPERRRNEQRRQPSLDQRAPLQGLCHRGPARGPSVAGRRAGSRASSRLAAQVDPGAAHRPSVAAERGAVGSACRGTARRGRPLDRGGPIDPSDGESVRLHDRPRDRATRSARPGKVRAARHIADRPGLASQSTDTDAAISTDAGSSRLRARFRRRAVGRRESQNAGSRGPGGRPGASTASRRTRTRHSHRPLRARLSARRFQGHRDHLVRSSQRRFRGGGSETVGGNAARAVDRGDLPGQSGSGRTNAARELSRPHPLSVWHL